MKRSWYQNCEKKKKKNFLCQLNPLGPLHSLMSLTNSWKRVFFVGRFTPRKFCRMAGWQAFKNTTLSGWKDLWKVENPTSKSKEPSPFWSKVSKISSATSWQTSCQWVLNKLRYNFLEYLFWKHQYCIIGNSLEQQHICLENNTIVC